VHVQGRTLTFFLLVNTGKIFLAQDIFGPFNVELLSISAFSFTHLLRWANVLCGVVG